MEPGAPAWPPSPATAYSRSSIPRRNWGRRPGDALEIAERTDDLRGVRQAPVVTVIEDLSRAAERDRRRLPAPAPAQPPAGQAARRQPRRPVRRAAQRGLDEHRPGRSREPHQRAAQGAGGGPAAAGLQPRQVPAHDRLRGAERRARGRRRPRAPRRLPVGRHDGHARGLRELQRRARSGTRWSRAASAPASSSATAATSAAARRSWARSRAAAARSSASASAACSAPTPASASRSATTARSRPGSTSPPAP